MEHRKLNHFNRLKDKNILITGSTSGIGKATAFEMAKEGANIIINFHSDDGEKKAEKIVKELENEKIKAIAIKADISKEDEVKKMFEQIKNEFGRLDVLVNNAGIQEDVSLKDMQLDQWEMVLNTNLTGAFLCSREAVKLFLKNSIPRDNFSARGKIIFNSSVHQKIAWPERCNYAASKGGLDMFMKSIAQELAPERIRVNSVAPGAIKTPINREAWEDEDSEKKLLKKIPYNRVGVPEDIAAVMIFLASDDSDYITGTTIFVDGGMTLYPMFDAGEQ